MHCTADIHRAAHRAGVTRAWVSAENVLGIEEDVVAEDVGAVGAAPVQAAAKTQKPMTTYRM